MTTPYAGNPSNFPDNVATFGSDAPSSANFNTCLEGTADRTAYLYARQSAELGQNWSRSLTVGTGTFVQNVGKGGIEWDPMNGQWMVADYDPSTSNHANIFVSFDGNDESWSAVASAPCPLPDPATIDHLAVGKDPNDTATFYLGAIYDNGSGPAVLGGIHKWDGSSWTTIVGPTGVVYSDLQFLGFAGYIVFATGASASGNTALFFSNDKMVTVTAVAVGGTVGNVEQWLLRQNGTMLIAAPANQAFATPFLYTSTDGHTFTLQTAGFGGNLIASDRITGLDWGLDSAGPCWIMTVLDTVANATKILRSSDGINWTLSATIADFGTGLGAVESLAAVGRLWVATLFATAPAPKRIAYSPDTVHWYIGSPVMKQPSQAFTFVRSNGVQIGVSNTFGTRFSAIMAPIVLVS